MGRSAKSLVVQPISSRAANRFVRQHHYSGKFTTNSCLHFGVFLDDAIEGVLIFGPSLDKRKMLGLVAGTKWHEFMELNRMVFTEVLPRNSESRAISVCMRLIRKNYPFIKWIVSFADASQCGDGTIYRASGFLLTQIGRSNNLVRLPSGEVMHKMTLENTGSRARPELGGRSYYDVTGGTYDLDKYRRAVAGTWVKGHQLRYIYFLHPDERQNLSVPILPFSEIQNAGAGMYRGQSVERHGQIPERAARTDG